jgi:hypothetical protein
MFKPSKPKLHHAVAALGVALALSGNAWAIADAQFEPAFAQFMQANQGNEAAIEKSAEAFRALLQQEPANPVLLAYAGAATAMQANTTLLPWKKMRYAEDGLAQLDKALALAGSHATAPLQHGVPAVLEVRYVAANTFLAVPGFMNRAARGSRLLAELLADPLLARAPLGFQGDVWMKAASEATKEKRHADARTYLQAVIDAQAPQAEAARAQRKALAP